MSTQPSVLITGASTGIGATYAERFARRGAAMTSYWSRAIKCDWMHSPPGCARSAA